MMTAVQAGEIERSPARETAPLRARTKRKQARALTDQVVDFLAKLDADEEAGLGTCQSWCGSSSRPVNGAGKHWVPTGRTSTKLL